MITIEGPPRWALRTPWVFRYLEKANVDAFFATGELYLSSFANFKKADDAQRKDGKEGYNAFFHVNHANGGQTLAVFADYGKDAYVLCGSLKGSSGLKEVFGRDDGIVIKNTVGFAQAVAKMVPGFRHGLEGACTYSDIKGEVRDFGYQDWEVKLPDGRITYDAVKAQKVIDSFVTEDMFFTKEASYFSQAEYRLLWFTDREITSGIKIVVPEARQYCRRFAEIVLK